MQASRKEYEAAKLHASRQHTHSLTLNSVNSDLLCLHVGSTGHCIVYYGAGRMSKVRFNGWFNIFGHLRSHIQLFQVTSRQFQSHSACMKEVLFCISLRLGFIESFFYFYMFCQFDCSEGHFTFLFKFPSEVFSAHSLGKNVMSYFFL